MTVDATHLQSVVDITPITSAIMQLVATLILGIGTWAISRLIQWLGLKNAAQATANLDDALQKGVTFGLQQTQELIKQKGWDNIEVHDEALGKALPYVMSRFPGALKAAGLDMSKHRSCRGRCQGRARSRVPTCCRSGSVVASDAPSDGTNPSNDVSTRKSTQCYYDNDRRCRSLDPSSGDLT